MITRLSGLRDRGRPDPIYYYQKVLVALYLEKKTAGAAAAKIHWPGAAAGLIAALLLLLIGLLPGPLMTLIERIIGRPPV